MKKLFELTVIIAFFAFGWSNLNYEVPTEHQLEILNGRLTDVREIIDDDPEDYNDHYVMLEIKTNGVTRNAVSYDKSLLSTLSPPEDIEVGLFKADNVSELWLLSKNNEEIIPIEKTDETRWNLIKKQVYFMAVIFIFFISAILFGKNSKNDTEITFGDD